VSWHMQALGECQRRTSYNIYRPWSPNVACVFSPYDCSDEHQAPLCKSAGALQNVRSADTLDPASICKAAGVCVNPSRYMCTLCQQFLGGVRAELRANMTLAETPGCSDLPINRVWYPQELSEQRMLNTALSKIMEVLPYMIEGVDDCHKVSRLDL